METERSEMMTEITPPPPESPESLETKTVEEEMEEPTHPIHRFFVWLHEVGNEVAEIKVKWLVAGMMIFLISVVFTQVQFNDVNQNERDKLVQDAQQADYLNDLAVYNQSRLAYQSCLDLVTRSDGNRAYQTWLLDTIGETFPNSEEADLIVSQGRLQLEQLLPPRSPDDCADPGPPPVAPDTEEGG